MADQEVSLAAAALTVALVALVIAVGQLLQQIFSTAEGYRRCQSSVLGPWALKTRLTWRWSQFRFEVKFTTPHLTMETNVPFQPRRRTVEHSITQRDIFAVNYTGSDATSIPIKKQKEVNTDLVGWIALLRQLESLQEAVWDELGAVGPMKSSVNPNALVLSPAMVLREWSWDFMPPEVVRPLATTTIGTLVVLAHRMGMVWRDLRPSSGALRAEGNGHTFTSTIIRGFGILVQYTYDDAYNPTSAEINVRTRIPTETADKLACGIIPGNHALNLPDIHIVPIPGSSGNATEAHTTQRLNSTTQSMLAVSLKSIGVADHVNHAITAPNGYIQLMSDLRSMFCPFLPLHGSNVTTVFNALPSTTEELAYREARIVLHARLQQYLSQEMHRTTRLVALSEHLETYASEWQWYFYNTMTASTDHVYGGRRFPLELIDFARHVCDEMIPYFKSLEINHGIRYIDLVAAHLNLGVAAYRKCDRNLSSGHHRDDGSLVDGPRAGKLVELFHCYADDEQMDVFVQDMEERGVKDRGLLVEAWWMLVMRGLFFSCTVLYLPTNEFPVVPAAFHNSRTPVYVT